MEQTKIVLNTQTGSIYATMDENQESHEKVIEVIDHSDPGHAKKARDCIKIAVQFVNITEEGIDFDELGYQIEVDKAYPEDYY